MTSPPPTLFRLIALPELASEILKYLCNPHLLRLRLVNKAFEELCQPYILIGILSEDLHSDLETTLKVISLDPQQPPKRPLPRLHYVTGLLPQTQQVDDLIMASPNLYMLTIRPGDDPYGRFYQWFLSHEHAVYPHVRSLRIDVKSYAQHRVNKALHPTNNLHSIFPNVEILRIIDDTGVDLEIVVQALENWPKLKAVNVDVDLLEVPDFNFSKFDAMDKAFSTIESLDIVTRDWIAFPNGLRLMDLLPNLKHLNMEIDRLQHHNPSNQPQQQPVLRGPRFPCLTSLTTTVTLGNLSIFYGILGLPPTWELPVTPAHATYTSQYPFLPPPPPLRKLAVDTDLFVGQTLCEAISDALTFCGISLQQLSQNNLSRYLLSFLRKPCCHELKVLLIADKVNNDHNGQDYDNWDFLILLMAPTPVPGPKTTKTTTTTVTTASVIADAINAAEQQQEQRLPANVPHVPLVSTFAWTKTLTELCLGSFEVDDHINQPIIPKLNTLLRLLPNLVIFVLMHVLEDLNIFKGMGRIPLSRLKAESEFFQQEPGGIEEKEKEKDVDIDGVGAFLDALDAVKVGVDGGKYVLRRPLFETVGVQLKKGTSFVDTIAGLHERFPHLEYP
ncbi:MAG: hypothetical protein JOS17DRAFT_787536 [Linnemannia elongata]|nr:MAG: hypothetical protein JOS17DRAFT_787536 [Linnemannia elongata]